MLAETVPPVCGPGTILTTGVVERVGEVRLAVTPEDDGTKVRETSAGAAVLTTGLTNAREVTPEVRADAGCSLGATVPEGGGPSEVGVIKSGRVGAAPAVQIAPPTKPPPVPEFKRSFVALPVSPPVLRACMKATTAALSVAAPP